MFTSGTLVVGGQARTLATAVLAPSVARLVPPLASWNRLVAIGLLPPEIRQQYGLTWTATNQRRFERSVARVRSVRRTLPDFLALWPEARA
jgi:uncharacterized protein (DUF2236 family)